MKYFVQNNCGPDLYDDDGQAVDLRSLTPKKLLKLIQESAGDICCHLEEVHIHHTKM